MFGKVASTLRTFSTVEGLPIIELSGGRELGQVLDLLFSGQQVTGFVIDKKGWMNRHLFLAVEDVSSFGQDGIMIDNASKLQPYKTNERQAYPLKQGKEKVRGKSLLTTEGEKLGLVEDVYFNEEVGTIIGYEVTDGLLADIVEGRKVVKGKGKLTVGKDKAILSI